ncbi:dihydrofolate reductase family protein [Actinokineospora sp. NBRC 105648]|uniref:dihydrofolate reductase family protein n=1 Tax=Actinokineospora sp. NBRC 105648 TaxID=3032206 RepID=UPI0024A30F4B|nr:dihydrofolate reductase family protein [Actinokineospora sp. NBRC 105648]GLZ42075.1 deaminase reductase [Actinokineospora sp. NBRC 105648]
MARLRVHNFTVTLDGYATGTNQRADAPFGDGVDGLHAWMFATRFGHEMRGLDGGSEGFDQERARAGDDNVGATIMGRNMFGPVRGPWPDHSWTGWWGDTPPYRHDVFVLTHHPRPSFAMDGGTTFHFVPDGPETALRLAFEAADGKDVRVGGGPGTVRQYLRAGLIDELNLVITPLLAGAGERLFDDLGAGLGAYECVELVTSETVTHARIVRR